MLTDSAAAMAGRRELGTLAAARCQRRWTLRGREPATSTAVCEDSLAAAFGAARGLASQPAAPGARRVSPTRLHAAERSAS